jgi:hypothetical protein
MGTRSLVYVSKTEKDAPFLCLYRQFDGYPSGMGKDLFNLLKGYKITDGFSGDDMVCAKCGRESYEHLLNDKPNHPDHPFETKRVANGINCLAATLVKGLKDGLNGIYLYSPRTKDAGQEYIYRLYMSAGTLFLKIEAQNYDNAPDASNAILYNGPLDEFDDEKIVEE